MLEALGDSTQVLSHPKYKREIFMQCVGSLKVSNKDNTLSAYYVCIELKFKFLHIRMTKKMIKIIHC